MKVRWIIDRKDGSTTEIVTEEAAKPAIGNGAIVNGIPVVVDSTLTTPMQSKLEKHDLVVAAKEL